LNALGAGFDTCPYAIPMERVKLLVGEDDDPVFGGSSRRRTPSALEVLPNLRTDAALKVDGQGG